jgi:hypothetical protein
LTSAGVVRLLVRLQSYVRSNDAVAVFVATRSAATGGGGGGSSTKTLKLSVFVSSFGNRDDVETQTLYSPPLFGVSR